MFLEIGDSLGGSAGEMTWALARPGIDEPGDHPAQTGRASRVFYPLRRSASECSAKGRSATRSDSQRWRERTRWDGHPAWGSTLGPSIALPKGATANGGGEEKNGGESSDSSRFARGTAVTAKAVRPFLFYAPQSLLPRYTRRRSTSPGPFGKTIGASRGRWRPPIGLDHGPLGNSDEFELLLGPERRGSDGLRCEFSMLRP